MSDMKKGLTLEEYRRLLFSSALTRKFLNRIKYVYGVKSFKEALSIVWSNDLIPIVNFMAEYYFNKYTKRKKSRKIIKKHRAELESKKSTDEKYSKYLENQNKLASKYYYDKKEYTDIIENFKKRIGWKDFKVEEFKGKRMTFENLTDSIINKKTERILVIKRK